MEIKGKITQLLEPITGQGQRGEWKRQDFIIETEGDYPKNVCIENWNDKIKESDLVVGSVLNVSINIESRSYNEKWYTGVKAWKCEVVSHGEVQHEEVVPAVEYNDTDTLPF